MQTFSGDHKHYATISFVAAASNSGKTTLIEKIIPLLKRRGLTVGVLKHASKGFDPERPGKDSWRFRKVGADIVAVAGPGGTALMRSGESEPAPEDLSHILGTCDIVLREGSKATEATALKFSVAAYLGPARSAWMILLLSLLRRTQNSMWTYRSLT